MKRFVLNILVSDFFVDLGSTQSFSAIENGGQGTVLSAIDNEPLVQASVTEVAKTTASCREPLPISTGTLGFIATPTTLWLLAIDSEN